MRVNKIDTRKLQAAGADMSHLSAALRGPALQLTLSQGGTGRSIQTILRRDHSGDKTDEESNELGSVGGGVDAERLVFRLPWTGFGAEYVSQWWCI